MPYNGSGAYEAPANSWNPAIGGTTIDSADFNSLLSDLETALSSVVTKDGQTTITANLPMSGFKHTGVNPNSGNTSRTEYASGATLQDGAPLDAGLTAGSSTVYTATLTPPIAAYADKQCFRVQIDETCGATPTIDFNSVGAKKMYFNVAGSAVQVTTGDLLANQILILRYDTALDTAAGGFWVVNQPYPLNVSGLTETTTVDNFADFVPIYDASATANRKVRPEYLLGLMRGHIWGLTLSNDGTDPTNDIGIDTGQAVDNTAQALMVLSSALIKQLDANWAAGTNQGMRYSGAAIANTTYHIWLVSTATGTTDIYATPNASASTPSAALTLLQAETGGASYVYIRRIGSIIRSGGAIVTFSQNGNEFLVTPVNSFSSANPGTSAVTQTLVNIPVGIVVDSICAYTIDDNSPAGVCQVLVTSLVQADTAPSASIHDMELTGAGTQEANSIVKVVRTNTSAQIRTRQSVSDADLTIIGVTMGWYDYRGQY